MRRRLVVLAIVASCSGAAAETERHTVYPWLRFSATVPDLPELESLALPDERRVRLVKEEWGFVDVLWRWEISIGADGKLVQRTVFARHYLDRNGVQSAGNLGVGARASTDQLILERAVVLLPDGARRECDLRNAEVVTSQPATIFSDQFEVVVPVEGLEPGATAVLVTTLVTDSRRWPLPWSGIMALNWFHPVEQIELAVRWERPQERPVWAANDERLECTSPSERELHCVTRPAEALKSDPDLRSTWDLAPQLVVAETQSWSSLVERELELFRGSFADPVRLRSIGLELAGSAETQRDKLERLHRYVAEEIRYVAREHGAAAVVPARVVDTLERQYADCKGKVALFVALAEQLGVRAWPVLVATDRYSLEALVSPSWKYFDHMIACAELGDGADPLCMDLTTPSAATGYLPPTLYGAVALELRPGVESPGLVATPETVWTIDVEARNRLSCDGDLVEEMGRTFSGAVAVAYRDLLRGMTAEERQRWAREDYLQVMAEGPEPEFTFEGLEAADRDLKIASTTSYNGLISDWTADYRELDAWLNHYASTFDTRNLHHPYHSPGVRIRSTISYQLCDDVKAGFTGPELAFDAEFGSLYRVYEERPNGVLVQTVLELARRAVEPRDLDRYRRFIDQILRQTLISFGLEPIGER